MQGQIDKANDLLSWLTDVLTLIADEFGVKCQLEKEFACVFKKNEKHMDWDEETIRSICEKKVITSDDVMTLSQYFNREPTRFM